MLDLRSAFTVSSFVVAIDRVGLAHPLTNEVNVHAMVSTFPIGQHVFFRGPTSRCVSYGSGNKTNGSLGPSLALTHPFLVVCQGSASGVRVNSVLPGLVETPILEAPHDTMVSMAEKLHLIPRPIQPEEVR